MTWKKTLPPDVRSSAASLFAAQPDVMTLTATPSMGPAAKTRPVAAAAPRILIVDDDPVILLATERKLKEHGYTVCSASDGPSAIRAVRTENPDLVVLDLEFPPEVPIAWDGFRILGWLHQMEATRQIPVVICTAHREKSLERRAHEAGAAGLFHKPVNFAALIALIELRLKSRPAQDSPGDDSEALSFEI